MRSLFDEDGQEESRSDADLTLGIGSLLSIFFGVVLICGIFFGFGYSMGRRNAHATAAPAVTCRQPLRARRCPRTNSAALRSSRSSLTTHRPIPPGREQGAAATAKHPTPG